MSDSTAARPDNVMPFQPDQFLLGWRKLPDELKLQVLGHALPSGLLLSSNSFTGDMSDVPDFHISLPRHIRPILACTEITTLALEVLYKQNTLYFIVFDSTPLLLPPKRFRKHPRSLRAATGIDDVGSGQFKTLASHSLGFPIMDNIALDFWGAGCGFTGELHLKSVAEELLAMETIVLNTKELVVNYKPLDIDPLGFSPYVLIVDDLDSVVCKLFTIAGEQEDIKMTRECRIYTMAGQPARIVATNVIQKWPLMLEKNYMREARINIPHYVANITP